MQVGGGRIRQEADDVLLRDYFAARAPTAPQGWLDAFNFREKHKANQNSNYTMRGNLEAQCEYNYLYADTMLAARLITKQ